MDAENYFTPKAAAPGADEKLQALTVKNIDTEKRRITGVASAEIVDRDLEIVTIDALKAAIDGFMANPVILASHSHRLQDGRSPVIGKVVSYQFKGKELLITVEFADTPLALEYWGLYRDKFQRAFSIGFRILNSKPEMREGKQIRVITEIELYEISCVPVPANPAALSKARKSFVQRKRLDREKVAIMDDGVAFAMLLDRRYEASGDIKAESEEPGYFSEAEKELLDDFERNILDDGADDEYFFDDEDYNKALFSELKDEPYF